MGYTHYFETKGPLDKNRFMLLKEDALKIINKANVDLAREYDEPDRKPEVTDKVIRFNGIGDDGHETFLLAQDQAGFEFCKTAAKPYDLVVTAILADAKRIFGDSIRVSSDGGPEEWQAGVSLASKALSAVIPNPIGVE